MVGWTHIRVPIHVLCRRPLDHTHYALETLAGLIIGLSNPQSVAPVFRWEVPPLPPRCSTPPCPQPFLVPRGEGPGAQSGGEQATKPRPTPCSCLCVDLSFDFETSSTTLPHFRKKGRIKCTCEEGMPALVGGFLDQLKLIHSFMGGENLPCEFLSCVTNKVQGTAPGRTGRRHCRLEHECG